MTLTKEILKWTDETADALDMDDKHATLKAFGLGAIEGFIDGAAIMYLPLVIGCYYWRKKAQNK